LIIYCCSTLMIVAIIKHGLGGGQKHYRTCVYQIWQRTYKWPGDASTIMCTMGNIGGLLLLWPQLCKMVWFEWPPNSGKWGFPVRALWNQWCWGLVFGPPLSAYTPSSEEISVLSTTIGVSYMTEMNCLITCRWDFYYTRMKS
jgi:hypothetical protein